MRNFSARETEWLQELEGIELAGFQRRALAFLVDWVLIVAMLSAVTMGAVYGYLKVREWHGHPMPKFAHYDLGPRKLDLQSDDPEMVKHLESEWLHVLFNVGIPVLYFGLLTWRLKGRTPGKALMRIRVVSIVHRHLTLWHSIERALGYGAAALELGFGFVQFFIHPYRRCAQDRLAETIVVTERSYRKLQGRASHPLLADGEDVPAARLADETLEPS